MAGVPNICSLMTRLLQLGCLVKSAHLHSLVVFTLPLIMGCSDRRIDISHLRFTLSDVEFKNVPPDFDACAVFQTKPLTLAEL